MGTQTWRTDLWMWWAGQHGNIHTNICKIGSQGEFAVGLGELKAGLWDNLAVGWGGKCEGGATGRGRYTDLWLIHADVWQQPTQYCNYPSIKNNSLRKKADT